ncbi:hypothetical protein [Pararhizobium arenae]|uniref:hypothetical protein n=1 Tax=Pararhizobium arenae TaxID=1856850 RepID=UPI000AC8B31C
MTHLSDNEIHFGVMSLSLGNVVEDNENVWAVILRVEETARVDQKRAPANRWELMADLEADDGSSPRYNGRYELP